MIDEIGRKLIAQRNGVQLGAARVAPEAAAEITRAASAVMTNRQGRQLLGIVATRLQQGYTIVATIPSNMWWGVLRWARYFDGTKNLADQARNLLDRTNAFAMRVYKTLPNNDVPISLQARNQVQVALAQASSSLQLISSAANEIHKGLIDDLIDAINAWVDGHTPSGFPKLPRATGKVIAYVAIGVAGIVGLVIAGKLIRTMVLGAAELGEAETTAMAIADAAHRKRSSRSVLSIV